MANAVKNYLNELYLQERYNFILFIPIIFACGIIYYFSLNYEPKSALYVKYLPALLIFAIAFTRTKYPYLALPFFILFLFYFGFSVAQFRAEMVSAPQLKEDLKFVWIRGKVDSVSPTEYGSRVTLSRIHIRELAPEDTPYKIRLSDRIKKNRDQAEEIQIGDTVLVKASLMKLAIPTNENAFDFARYAYFQQIGATGFIVKPFRVIKPNKNKFMRMINQVRSEITTHVVKAIGAKEGYVATALMVGEYSGLDKQTLENIRIAGLAHLLSVSGMHLSLVVGIVFLVIRFICARSEYLALKFNLKKLSAVVALVASFFYLLISGVQIAALRAFIMASIFIFSIIFDRFLNPMRSIATACFFILLIWPETILSASFHMSFAAVLALIASYDLYKKYLGNYVEKQNIGFKILFYFISLSFSSLVASLATTPFTIYHFHQFSTYNIVANLLAVPLTSFIYMPLVVICFILYPVGLDYPFLYILGKSLSLLNTIAEFVANQPAALILTREMPVISLLYLAAALVIFSIFRTNIRYSSIIPLLICIYFYQMNKLPFLLINSEKRYVGYYHDGGLELSQKRMGKMVKDNWLKLYGLKEEAAYKDKIHCEKKRFCIINTEIGPIEVNFDERTINRKSDTNLVSSKKVFAKINFSDIKEDGNLSLFLEQEEVKFKGSLAGRVSRRWYSYL